MASKAVTKEDIVKFFEEGEESPEFEDKKLGRVASLANQVIDLEGQIKEQEAALKSLKEKKRAIAEDLLPAVVDEYDEDSESYIYDEEFDALWPKY